MLRRLISVLLVMAILAGTTVCASADSADVPEATDPMNSASSSMSFAESGEEQARTDTAAPEETLPVAPETADALPEEQAAGETTPEEHTAEETAMEESEAPTVVPEELPTSWSHDVPLYFQNDYPDNMYGYGTIESSGCSITSLAMVATYLTGHTYLPDELARYFGGRAENNMARMEAGSDAMELPYTKNTNWHETLAALKEGKIAIVLMNEKSVFTTSQHFLVLTGITEEGKILVNDPYLPNYDRAELQAGFASGFDPLTISNGYSGGWVYDPAAMPEEPFLYHEEEPELPEPRYPDIHLSREDRELLARVIWVEARGESFEGQQAVAEVVLNRIAAEGFQSTLRGVIYAEGQFRSVPFLEDAEPYQTQYEAVEKALYGPYVLPKDVYYFATYQSTERVWGKIGGHIFCYAE